ncbi:hypothetical protein I302_107460 [Kwoniella bestiolae CBS 10118]|uniref:Developmental regulatory protein wetA n=1 Tax=Kwoniella bestiolae CBS 10118 TaxID=1296100 RepID=A0A1B9FYH7_9TREE|nr:hypothetical protein I302_06799 [Kwoniella bestiolae CBS 10118]OCF23815.1 hypothetical protein I302_06799 [Kwoniella bestiolae CBS 10118]
MESIFENDSFLFDPSSSSQYETSNFLSFSSFSEQLSTWEDFAVDLKNPPARSVSDTSSPTLSEPFEFPSASFEPVTPAETSSFGIFHTPEKKIANSGEDQTAFFSHRSSGSTDSWGEPITPSLSGKSFAALSGNSFTPSQSTPGFAWDEAAPSFSGSSYTPPTPAFQTQPHRVTSNPVLGSSSRQPRTLNKPTSMPVLKEEETPSSQWLDGTNFLDNPIEIPSAPVDVPVDATELEDFVWNLNDQNLGFDNFSAADTIFAAFTEPTDAVPMMHSHSHTGVFPSQTPDLTFNPSSFQSDFPSWMSGLPATQDVVGLGQFDFANFNQNQPMGLLPAFTIDPTAVMGTNAGVIDEDASRPSSAPGLNGGEETKGMLSVPTADVMTRSLSSEGFVPSRHAPPRDLFSYAPQPIPSGPPGPQPLYTSDPSPSYQQFAPSSLSYGMPPTPTRSSSRKIPNNLSIKIHPPAQSTFVPSPFPPTPQSATFSNAQAQNQQPIAMQRAGTQPLPQTRRLSGAGIPQPGLPAHLARAEAIVAQQAAREEAERASIRRQAASKRVGMAEASVMQPTAVATSGRRAQPTIMGWEGPSAQTGSLPVLTHTPLVTIHPPPAQYLVTGAPIPVQRVHPPPHPGTSAVGQPRQIARLPSSPNRVRKASSSNQLTPTRSTPKSRSPSSAAKRKASGAGGFSFADPFINFTADDAEKLLTGVAPSGSQSKRKREEEAAAARAIGVDDGARSKRSKSDE